MRRRHQVLVHRSLYDQVVDGLSAAADAQVLGDPLDPATTMGALVNAKQRDTVRQYIESGKAEGARLAAGAAPHRRASSCGRRSSPTPPTT